MKLSIQVSNDHLLERGLDDGGLKEKESLLSERDPRPTSFPGLNGDPVDGRILEVEGPDGPS